MSKRIKKSPPGLVRIMVSVNTGNLTPEEHAQFQDMPGSIKTSGWVEPEIADKVLRALYKMEPR